MNTRIFKWVGLVALAVAAVAATTKISEYPATVTLSASDKFLIASGATNKHITWASLGALTSGTNMVQFTNGILTVNGSAIVNGGMTINGAASVTKATNAVNATNLFSPYEYITNGHTGAITISNDVTVVGTLTVSSTNSTTTVSNLLVTGTISGAGTNDIFQASTNAAWTATQGATNATVLAAVSASNATNLYNANLPVPTNSPSAGKVISATSASSSEWATPTGGGSSNITDSGYSAVARNAQISTNLEVITSGLGTTITPTVWLTNTTVAGAGAQQVSPAIMLGGHGWKTASTAASQPVKMGWYVLPAQGSSAPKGSLTLAYSINNAALADQGVSFSTDGSTTLAALKLGNQWQFTGPSGVIPLTVNTNNWAPASTFSLIRMTNSTAGNVNITGFESQAQVSGTRIILYNLTAEAAATITLVHESTDSTAAYRFALPGNTNLILNANESVELMTVYDGSAYRWRVLR